MTNTMHRLSDNSYSDEYFRTDMASGSPDGREYYYGNEVRPSMRTLNPPRKMMRKSHPKCSYLIRPMMKIREKKRR